MVTIDNDPLVLFTTERLRMRRIVESDSWLLQRIFCEADMMEYLGGPWDTALARETLDEWTAAWGNDNYYYGVLEAVGSGDSIGIAGFSDGTNPNEPGIEIAWFVLPAFQGRGYAREISREILCFAFDRLGKDRVFAETHPDNAAAIRALRSRGFTPKGTSRYAYDFLPGMTEQAIFEYKKDDWIKSKGA